MNYLQGIKVLRVSQAMVRARFEIYLRNAATIDRHFPLQRTQFQLNQSNVIPSVSSDQCIRHTIHVHYIILYRVCNIMYLCVKN